MLGYSVALYAEETMDIDLDWQKPLKCGYGEKGTLGRVNEERNTELYLVKYWKKTALD